MLFGLAMAAALVGQSPTDAPAPSGTGTLDFETPPSKPASGAAERVIERLDWLRANIVTTKYQHQTRIRRREGYFAWDCSAMVTWVLARAAPRARSAIERERPVAVSYFRAINRAPTHRARDGWRRIERIEGVRPGDVFAWKRPPDFPSKNTGHVGFVVEPPVPVPNLPGAYKVRIADASRYRHEDDTRPEGGDGGFGEGTILFVTDDAGTVVGYGWFGDPRWIIETPVVFGRVTR